MLYVYLKQFDGVVASHTSATVMGTDWRDNDPRAEPAVEIYQGDRQNYEIPQTHLGLRARRIPSVAGVPRVLLELLALDKGYRLGFEASGGITFPRTLVMPTCTFKK